MLATIPSGLTVQDTLRLHLGEYGQKNISVTIDELANRMKQPRASIYQAIHRLEKGGEIILEKVPLDETPGREKIVGIKLVKLEQSGRTYRRSAERSGKITRIKPVVEFDKIAVSDNPTFPTLIGYMQQRLAVENMRQQAINAGLSTDVIQFTTDPMSEEALILYKINNDLKEELEELKGKFQQQGFDLEAEKRNNLYLRDKLREETVEDLVAMGAKD